jgi:hypothetical protein
MLFVSCSHVRAPLPDFLDQARFRGMIGGVQETPKSEERLMSQTERDKLGFEGLVLRSIHRPLLHNRQSGCMEA